MTNYLHLPEQERLLYTEFLIRQAINAAKLPQVHIAEKVVSKLSRKKIIGMSLMTLAFIGITYSFYFLIENRKQKKIKMLGKNYQSQI
jgi:hypothetical protein